MDLKRAGDLMIPLDHYPHIPYWFTLRQAIAEMEKSDIEIQGRKSLPRLVLVFDETYKLLGMVRRRDLLRGLEPSFLAGKPLDYRKKLFDVKVDPNLSLLSPDELLQGLRERAERPVRDVMLPIQVTVGFEESLVKVIYEMVDRNLSLIPVMKGEKVVGVIRSVDVFHEIALLLL
jgi:CBS domain-containing protein